MAPVHRRPDGSSVGGSTYEGLVDRLIRDARERGEWDESAFHGRPLPSAEDERYAGDMALANHILRNAGAAPPWIEADQQVRRLAAEIDDLRQRLAAEPADRPASRRLRERLTARIAEHDTAVQVVNAQAPTPRQHRRPLGPLDDSPDGAHSGGDLSA
ncbi:MAG TPA: DUF1992 domain-containing protein [Candidatus Limnocylindrales bacterium]|nr:DUF1992 domain-containing protein [Candidatus Limnocylindrales bacterium]